MSFPFPKRIKGGTFNQSSAVTVENKTHLFGGIQVCRKVGMKNSYCLQHCTDPKYRVKGYTLNGLNQLFDRNLNPKMKDLLGNKPGIRAGIIHLASFETPGNNHKYF